MQPRTPRSGIVAGAKTALPLPLPLPRAVTLALAMAVTLVLGACSNTTSTTATEVGTNRPATSAGCPPAEGAATRTTSFESVPPTCIDVTKTYTAVVQTTAGAFTVQLDPTSAPLAANNFVYLARNHYYDGVSLHRIIPGFVIQGGDATGSPAGTGSPGYAFKDELPVSASVYQPGTMAMANAGPDTNGSQFFVVLAPGRLQAKYSVFGKVTQGFDTTVQAIAKTGTETGTPTSPTTITSIKVTES